MHYRNGREAANGDKVVQLSDARYGDLRITAVGVLIDAKAGNDYCNGTIAPLLGGPVTGACLCDCVHADDIATLLRAASLDVRPAGK